MLAFDLPGVRGDGRRVPAHKLNAVSGVGRRVASSGEAGGYLGSYVTFLPEGLNVLSFFGIKRTGIVFWIGLVG